MFLFCLVLFVYLFTYCLFLYLFLAEGGLTNSWKQVILTEKRKVFRQCFELLGSSFDLSKTSNRGDHFHFLLATWSSFFLITQMLECALNMNATELVVAKLAWLITRRLFWLVVLCLTSQLFCYNHDLGLCTFNTLSLLSRRLNALIAMPEPRDSSHYPETYLRL